MLPKFLETKNCEVPPVCDVSRLKVSVSLTYFISDTEGACGRQYSVCERLPTGIIAFSKHTTRQHMLTRAFICVMKNFIPCFQSAVKDLGLRLQFEYGNNDLWAELLSYLKKMGEWKKSIVVKNEWYAV